MNPSPHGYVIPGVHLGTPHLSDKKLAQAVAQTWCCMRCLHVERDSDPARLRDKARDHAKGHGDVAHAPAEAEWADMGRPEDKR